MPTTVTSTIKSAGGDYTSLSAWEAAKQADIVTADQIQQAECYAFNDTTAFTINGWTTDATRYIRIYAATGEGHSGYWDAAKYLLSATNANLITVLEEFVRIEGLQIQVTSTGSNAGIIVSTISGTSEVRIQKCLGRGVVTGASGAASFVNGNDTADGNCKVVCINCVAFDFFNSDFPNSAAVYGFTNTFANLQCYNCTAYKCGTGFNSGATYKTTAVNCLSYCDILNTSRVDFAGSTTFQNSSNNASTDTTAPGTSPLISQLSTDIDFLSTTHTDANFLAIDSTSTLVGAGTNDPLTGVYSDDVRGATRTSTWDIGADEFISVGGATVGIGLTRSLRLERLKRAA